ncbi:MAG: DUF1295 domain-containing protein [Puia sp.]|nr:DUF1295 domain-containing protein [Puia sp.]
MVHLLNSQFLSLILLSLIVVCLLMWVAWIWATKINNAGIVDVFWAFNFSIINIIIWILAGGGNKFRKDLVCGLGILWSLRLGIHLQRRVFSHLREEEGRYRQLRKEWAERVNTKFFLFFQAQALSNVILSIPFFIIALDKDPVIRPMEYAGAFLWLVSIAGEAIADRQLSAFKKGPGSRGLVCMKGLWNYSRHPNYFFQLMIWIGVFIFALPGRYGWIAILSPLSIAYLLFKVTGIPLTEEQSVRSKGEAYREYQRTTHSFIPWFKKS